MKSLKQLALVTAVAAAAAFNPIYASAADAAPMPAPTPKNWTAPSHKMLSQVLVDELMAKHPELMSITMHAHPPGAPADVYTMIAGSFPDRIGNQSSPGDVITLKKGVSQIESKWGTPDYQKKVSAVMPLKDASGKYIPAAMVIAFKTSPGSGMIDTDFLKPAISIRDGLQKRIGSFDTLFEPAK
ncbi:hypothetical protein [Massilia cavernae]|uniref:SRPBCC family protein n=1 Tax=Massilia cavernae TaxID=2320864 RepID=A0A418XFN9_9BURK|nr:hypothetical protein [Massilia cavernae]RJG11283.1 hypothetical protein D3872_20695 [Massilia cavernae]